MNIWTYQAGRLLESALNGLIPHPCLLCRQDSDEAVCQPCAAAYLQRKPPRCRQCAEPLPATSGSPAAPGTVHTAHAGLRCGNCLRQPPAFDRTLVVCDYAAPLDQLVLALKFGHQPGIARWMARRLADTVVHSDRHVLPAYLCAVPLSEQRLSERGYNQSHEIARYLAQMLGIPFVSPGLLRIRDTAAQSGLSLELRKSNLRRAFEPSPDFIRRLRGAHIGLVDDVITTGTTLHEIAKMLKHFGAENVTNYLFARTPTPAS